MWFSPPTWPWNEATLHKPTNFHNAFSHTHTHTEILNVLTSSITHSHTQQSLVIKCMRQISAGRGHVPNVELCFNGPLIGNALHLELQLFLLCRI